MLLLVLGEPRRAGDANRLRPPGRHVLGRDIENPIGIDIKRDLDLRDAAGGQWQTIEIELPEARVVGGHRPLALIHVHRHASLRVGSGSEDFRTLHGDWRVTRDQGGRHTTERLHT